MSNPIKNHYDFVFVFDVRDVNPNGDPDAGNLPRLDPETGMGLVTDVCLKRKVRNYVQITNGIKKGYDIFIKEKAILNDLIDESHEQDEVKTKEKGKKTEAARKWMCEKYFDIRSFGAVMSTGENAGQVRGSVQLTVGRSIEPVAILEHSIMRMTVATQAEAEKQSGDNRTMGRKNTIPYGLYVAYGFVSANLAKQTGFSEDDLELLWDALKNMFEHDRSAARGLMSTQKLVVFKHSSPIGNAHAYQLFDLVKIARKTDSSSPARSFSDYEVTIDRAQLPHGIEIFEK